MIEPLIKAKNICKKFPQGVSELEILKNINFQIVSGEAVSIVGSSGAGKSTLLHILGTLDRPTSGEVFFEGENISLFDDEQLSKFRNKTLGFVFQFHHLLKEFSALENVSMPMRISGESKAASLEHAYELLNTMGLADRADHYPSQLSGGELQRVAIARALVCKPRVLLADEPTGNLDSSNGEKIKELFFELKEKFGLTLIVVTHDAQFASKFSRSLRMQDGQWIGV
jgi:lipoprotein-releasing system ATP-binding protein